MRWLVISIALSVVLTVLLNVGLRAFPNTGHRVGRWLSDLGPPNPDDGRSGHRVRTFVPWKAMILVSVILTIVLNVLLWIT